MDKEKQFFDWRWDNEKPKSEYQLVIERSSQDKMYQSAELDENEIIFTDHTKNKIRFNLNKYLKDLFIQKYSILDPIDLEALLEYHFKAFKGDKQGFLKHTKTILMGMKVLNQFDPNPEGKLEIGKLWIEEKLTSIAPKRTDQKESASLGDTTINKPERNDLSFKEAFQGKKFEGDRVLEILMDNGYIDENYVWLMSKIEYIGLLHCLIENNLTRVKKFATLDRILRTVINVDPISRPTYEGAAPYIYQFEEILSK